MRTSVGQMVVFLLACAAPACLEPLPFLEPEEGCLAAGESVVVELADAKTKPAPNVATVPAWTYAPDSDSGHLHLRVRGCEEGWSSWGSLSIVGELPEGSSLLVKTRTHEDGTWLDASPSAATLDDATYSTFSEGGDLEVVVELADAPDARIDQIVLVRSCSTDDGELDEEETDDGYDPYDDEGC